MRNKIMLIGILSLLVISLGMAPSVYADATQTLNTGDVLTYAGDSMHKEYEYHGTAVFDPADPSFLPRAVSNPDASCDYYFFTG